MVSIYNFYKKLETTSLTWLDRLLFKLISVVDKLKFYVRISFIYRFNALYTVRNHVYCNLLLCKKDKKNFIHFSHPLCNFIRNINGESYSWYFFIVYNKFWVKYVFYISLFKIWKIRLSLVFHIRKFDKVITVLLLSV